MISIQRFFDERQEAMLDQAGDLYKALTYFRYEGKLFKKENIKTIQTLANDLEMAAARHRNLQEKIIFPFLQTHIPRHEIMICLMETEHEDMANQIEKLKREILKISKGPMPLSEWTIYETGIYLVTLLRHHIGFEKRNIGRTLQKELGNEEKETIHQQIEDWLKKENP